MAAGACASGGCADARVTPAMYALRADSPLQYVRGVGPRIAEAFATLGLRTVADLLEYVPCRYEIEHGATEIAALRPGMSVTIRGEVTDARRDYAQAQCTIRDGTGACTLRWFHAPYAGRGLPIGAVVIAAGRVREWNGRLEIVQPRMQAFPRDTAVALGAAGARLVGVYRGNQRIPSSVIRRTVRTILERGSLPVDEIVPPGLRRRHGLPDRAAALRQLHLPDGDDAIEPARARLAYEEFLLLELAVALRRRRLLAREVGRTIRVTPEIDRRIRARFPFRLTPSQDKVVREVARDLGSGRPMTRLLQGDVGSGKTVVALYACLAAVANGRQAAIMAPTEILAEQHFRSIERYLEASRVRRILIRGGLRKAQRAAAMAAIERGEIDLIVGTQALLEHDVAFRDLSLVVVDEQHKFGVRQRADFRTKGPTPHYLVMTATPIPRTLAMTVFGDLDVSILDAPPPGRGRIVTRVVSGREWDVVMGYVRGRLEAGEQAYVVCPQIGAEGRDGELRTVRVTHERLVRGPWRGLNVTPLHGGMKSAEKDAVIRAFAGGRLQAVVSTTVVEVGVDVPTATIMIVEHAERFGLSQLHQLRGRVGRGAKDSLCVLIAYAGGDRAAARGGARVVGPVAPGGRAAGAPDFGAAGGKAAERLAILAETTDGFRIAEADLRQRGPGELLGTKQHGLPELRFGNLVNDFGLLERARRDAFEIVARDPALAQPEHAALRPALGRLFAGKLALIEAG